MNPLALEEFAALEQRHKFLTEQLADLTATRKDLLTIIDEIDEKMQDIFSAAFEDTRAAFDQVFPVLFPGGTGSLFLTNPDELLTTGIEVTVKPAGKKIERLSLLSGGERSLAAVALLIAIFKARPSPFYIMDEVEAALDDANLGRLLTILEDLRASSQLIVITHQKRTMEIADALYGVSMRQDGVSAVVGQRVVARTARADMVAATRYGWTVVAFGILGVARRGRSVAVASHVGDGQRRARRQRRTDRGGGAAGALRRARSCARCSTARCRRRATRSCRSRSSRTAADHTPARVRRSIRSRAEPVLTRPRLDPVRARTAELVGRSRRDRLDRGALEPAGAARVARRSRQGLARDPAPVGRGSLASSDRFAIDGEHLPAIARRAGRWRSIRSDAVDRMSGQRRQRVPDDRAVADDDDVVIPEVGEDPREPGHSAAHDRLEALGARVVAVRPARDGLARRVALERSVVALDQLRVARAEFDATGHGR